MKNKVCWSIIIFALFFPLIMGCTNAPGAVRMKLTPQKASFAPAEPILIDVTLTVVDSPVCLNKSCFIATKLECMGTEFTKESYGYNGKIIYCGTGNVEMLLLAPILLPAALLDVGDCLGRFEVIAKGNKKTLRLIITSGEKGLTVVNRDKNVKNRSSSKSIKVNKPLLPDRYRLQAKLIPYSGTSSHPLRIFPPPLFWKPYDHPVEAQTEIIIKREN
ncbi:MAG: hypothetical protein ACYTF1_14200 [Planctomycetota bacterium]|jgi:hypothetical protein